MDEKINTLLELFLLFTKKILMISFLSLVEFLEFTYEVILFFIQK